MSFRTSPKADWGDALAALGDEWEEQSRVLYWVFRDLGREPASLFDESPFRSERKSLPCSGVRV